MLDDIIFSLQRTGGISVYWAKLHEYLSRSGIRFSGIRRKSSNNINLKELSESTIPIQYGRSQMPLAVDRYLCANSSRKLGTPTLFHSSYYRLPSNRRIPAVVTVYDFAYEHFMRGAVKHVHHLQKVSAIRRADRVICISKTTLVDALRYLPNVQAKCSVVHLAVDPIFFERRRSTRKSDVPYLLWVGKRHGYKNFSQAAEFWISQSDFDLVLVGGESLTVTENRLLETNANRTYTHIRPSGTDELARIYAGAHALLYLSKYEGFGLPILEAMASRCPVIVANSSASIETAGGNALTIPMGAGRETLRDKIDTISDTEVRKRLASEGYIRASQFAWDITMSKTLEVYRSLE